MKFRGKVQDIACIQQLSRIVSALSKLCRLWCLRLTASKLQLLVPAQASHGNISILAELPQASFFDEYLLEGVSAEANEIYLEVCTEGLGRALRSALTAKALKIKLTKRHGPCLTIEIELPSVSGRTRLVVHDVPVTVVPRRLWDTYQEPDVPAFDISLHLPQLKLLKNVVDKMKNIAKYVELRCSSNTTSGCELSLRARTELVTISTHFRDLQRPVWKTSDASSMTSEHAPVTSAERDAAVAVDLSKLAQLLTCQSIAPPSKALISVVHTEMVHVFLAFGDVTLQYFLPGMAS